MPYFAGEGLKLPYKNKIKIDNCSTGLYREMVTITNRMEAFIFSFIPTLTAKVSKFHYNGIKRKMRFLHQPVFSRIDRGKNREISDWTNGLGEKFIFLQPIELPYNEIQRI